MFEGPHVPLSTAVKYSILQFQSGFPLKLSAHELADQCQKQREEMFHVDVKAGQSNEKPCYCNHHLMIGPAGAGARCYAVATK